MIKIDNNKYYTICDTCGKEREVTKDRYSQNIKKQNHYCNSCCQKGNKNHSYNKKPWNYGKTKEDDERVAQYGINGSKTKKSQHVPGWNKNKTYIELKGEKWAKEFKERISNIKKGKPNYKRRYVTFRNKSYKHFRILIKSRLYCEWTFKILKRDEYICKMCGDHNKLEVHHIRPFKDILEKVSKEIGFDLNNYEKHSEEVINKFVELVIKDHNIDEGITLCKKCHCKVDKNRKKFCIGE